MKKILVFVVMLLALVAAVGCRKPHTSEYKVLTIDELKAAPSIEISFRVPFAEGIRNAIQDLIDSFNVEYPNVNITLDHVSGYDPMKESIIQDIAGGKAPTMAVGYPDHFAEYLITESIINLKDFMSASDPVIGYSQTEMDDFLPGYLEENRQFARSGGYHGLPFNKSTEVMYYNVDFFETFDLEVPKTWAELEVVSAAAYNIVAGLTDTSYAWMGKIKTNIDKGEFMTAMYDSSSNYFITMVREFGGEYTGELFLEDGIVDVQRGAIKFVNNAKAKDALTYVKKLSTDKVISIPDIWEQLYGSNMFINSQVLLNIGSSAGASNYSKAIAKWAVAPIPYKDADHKYVIQQGTNVAIFSQATDLQKLAAWLFIKHCLTPENTVYFARKTSYMPVRKSAYDLPSYTNFLTNPSPAEIGASKVHNATIEYAKEGWTYFVDPAWAGSAKVRTEVGTALAQIVVYKKDVQTAFDEALGRIGQR